MHLVVRRKKGDKETVGNLERTFSWAGLRKGDAVDIAETGLRSASWEFVAHVKNLNSGEEWIEVVGGKQGDRAIRSFDPSRVFPPKHPKAALRKQQQSLSAAPQLPLE